MSFKRMIEVANLSKKFNLYSNTLNRLAGLLIPRLKKKSKNEYVALQDISFNVQRGETIGIIGKNGAGKSTLLQIITGTLTPNSGSVIVYGKVAALLELGSGFNPEYSGIENIYMNATLLGLNRKEIDSKIQKIIEFADIGEFVYQPVKIYSSGMLLRLAFSVIAHVDAEILIIDEALAVGDAFFTQKCMRFIRDFKKNGTLILVTHDMAAVRSLCDRVLWIEKGRLRADGDPDSISKMYIEEHYNELQTIKKIGATQEHKNRNKRERPIYDARRDWVNLNGYRNDIKIFKFNGIDGFGNRNVSIVDVRFENDSGETLLYVVGGELVKLTIDLEVSMDCISPIVGFFLKDRLGQTLFGDNTFITYIDSSITLEGGREYSASFEFQMPRLPKGDYMLTAAVASGTQSDNVQEHWIHDALLIKSESSCVASGLIGISMHKINIEEEKHAH